MTRRAEPPIEGAATLRANWARSRQSATGKAETHETNKNGAKRTIQFAIKTSQVKLTNWRNYAILPMLRLLEHTLISTVNRALDKRRNSTNSVLERAPDVTLIGQTIPLLIQAPRDRASLPFRRENVTLSVEARRRHVYILGATGTGKTNLLMRLVESDIVQGRSLCVVDLRGDLIDRVLLRLAAHAPPEHWTERLLLFDLRDERAAVGFNPLVGEGDIYNRALHVLSVLKAQAESWGVQIEETCRNSLLALADARWTLLEVEPLLINPAFRAQVVAQSQDARVRSFFERFNALSSAQQTTWALAVLNKIGPLISLPALRRVFGQRQGLPLRNLLDESTGQVILVSLAVDRLHDAARLAGGLFVSSFQNAIMARADQNEASRVPVNLYVDEFETMASDRFQSIVAEGRRFGLGLTLSHQNNNQLDTDLRHVLRNNVHTQFYFQTGALDAAELSKEISGGETREDVRNTLISQGVGQCFLIRRGQPSVRVQVLPCPDPRVGQNAVEEIRAAARSRFARPISEIDRELTERERSWSQSAPAPTTRRRDSADVSSPRSPGSLNTTSSQAAQNENSVSELSGPTYEIRHEKLDHFRARFADDDEEEDS